MSAEKVSEVFHLLVSSSDLCLLWHFLFTLMTMMIVFSGVRKGIEHWSRIMTRSLFAMLFALFLYSCTLPGMGPAIEFILYPNFETFTFSSVLEALGLSFFTLSLGQGIMFSYGSYTSDQEDLPMMSIIVSFAVIIVAILGALTIFPVVFTFGFEPSAGTGLIFQALPYLFSKLPGGVLISTLFFSLFVFAGLTSAMAFVEVVASNMMELMGWSRKKAALLVSMATFIFGIPSALAGSGILFSDWQEIYRMNFLETMDNFVSVWLIPVGGLITTVFVGWIWNKEASQEEFLKGSSCSPRLFSVWYYAMRFLVPGLIILIILQKSGLINFD
ncbi:MAG: sodium-dependent transporter [Chlamydiae bacterium]|nr:sodium-dependent transporter [Chlamydiota bacterium]